MTHPLASEYTWPQRQACRSVLIELIHILGDFVDDMAIVGGWVPELLIPNPHEEHVGTMDIDLAFNPENISEDAYTTINELLTTHGFSPNDQGNAQFKYFKTVTVEGVEYTVEVDLLTGEYLGETGRNRRHESIQDIKALKARGVDLVFDRTETVTIEGGLPNQGGKDILTCKVAGIVPFIIMKGIVLTRRKKEKDAYDLEYVLRNYPGGVHAVAQLIAVDINHTIVKESLRNIEAAFSSPEHYGPVSIVDFLGIDDPEARVIKQRLFYQTVQDFLNELRQRRTSRATT